MSNTKEKPVIKLDTKCCRTCHYVRPVKKVLWGCTHASMTINTKNRGEQILKVKADSVCKFWEVDPMLAKFHESGA